MAETVIDYKDEAAIVGIAVGAGLLALFFIGEPFVNLWHFVVTAISEHLTKIRLFVYAAALISVLALLFVNFLVYVIWGKWSAIAFFIALHFINFAITKDDMLLQFIYNSLKSLFLWIFGTVS